MDFMAHGAIGELVGGVTATAPAARGTVRALAVLLVLACTSGPEPAYACDADNGGLRLPDEFCATVFASDTGPVRNLTVSADGDVFAALRARGGSAGGVLALRDADRDGRADERNHFGRGSGHGIALAEGYLYYAAHDEVLRWRWQPRQLTPRGVSELVVGEFPQQTSHREKALALGSGGELYVSVGGPSNACQEQARTPSSPGLDPCPQLALQAGVWKYDATQPGQRHGTVEPFATGLRHTLALALRPHDGSLWGAVNGRDQLQSLWGFSEEASAELPAEEFVRLEAGTDLGWPYCYYDGRRGVKVLAPEYGGDGRKVGRCAAADSPALAFPAHWAPMALAFYDAEAFPARYRGGLFVAFRGSWNRAPRPQEGYRVAFVPFDEEGPTGYETFAIGAQSETQFRMTGLAVGPRGALYVADDTNQRIWRIEVRPPQGSTAQ